MCVCVNKWVGLFYPLKYPRPSQFESAEYVSRGVSAEAAAHISALTLTVQIGYLPLAVRRHTTYCKSPVPTTSPAAVSSVG